jgi:predicted dehydrogenase
MSTSDFTIALIGLGYRLTQVARHLKRAAPQVRFAAFHDPSPNGLARLEREGISPAAYDDPAAMLRAVKPDAVMIGSPNHLHLDHVRLALDHAPRVFCEKPLARTEEESFELAALLALQGADRLVAGFVLRSLPVVRETLTLMAEGALGTLTSFEANEHLHPEHGGFLMRDWRRHRRHAGSYLLDKCCHDIDLFNAVAESRPRRIASFAARRIFTPQHRHLEDEPGIGGSPRYRAWPKGWQGGDAVFDSDADTADTQTLIMEYENGVLGTFHTNTHVNPPRRTWFLAGTEAAADVDLRSGRITLSQARDGLAPRTIEAGGGSTRDHYGADPAMARDLAASWLAGSPFPVTARDALIAGLAVMAADRAAQTGTVVDLSPHWQRLDALLP